MPSRCSVCASPSADGATRCVSTPAPCSACASRSTNEPGASPRVRGKLWVRKRTFIVSRAVLPQLIELPPKLSHLCALPGDLFADESRREKDAAQRQPGDD